MKCKFDFEQCQVKEMRREQREEAGWGEGEEGRKPTGLPYHHPVQSPQGLGWSAHLPEGGRNLLRCSKIIGHVIPVWNIPCYLGHSHLKS